MKKIEEGHTPSEVGGFVFRLPFHHKIFANCGGLYIQIDTGAEAKYFFIILFTVLLFYNLTAYRYDSTGLVRVHKSMVDPLVGPSDVSAINIFPSSIGVGWPTKSGNWEYLVSLIYINFYFTL